MKKTNLLTIASSLMLMASTGHAAVTMSLRLDATQFTSAGPITTWEDSSGNGYDATNVSNPEVVLNAQNSLPVVRFDGNDYFTIADSFTAGSAFVVAKYNSSTFNGFDGLLSGDNTGDGNALYFAGNNGQSYLWGETSLNNRYFDGVSGVTGPTALSIDEMSLYSGTDSTPTSWNGYAIGADRPTGLFGGGRAWEGDIAEVIIYEDTLSDFDRKGVEMYLNDKWGLGITPYADGTYNTNLKGLLLVVPEPSSTALLGLGGLALALRRRR